METGNAMNELSKEPRGAKTTAEIERPTASGANAPAYGSDVIAECLRQLDIRYVALNPGSSYRGLHDSIVNYLGNETPQMIVCQHEGTAVAVAHGYAKATGRAMAAAVHSNVGLMQATMGIFNAWCDRMPMLVLGATGPVDAAKRRPGIDWLHTARDQGALIRNFIKWDDQPASPAAAREGIFRGAWLANTEPKGPVYLNFDAEMQEAKLIDPLPPFDPSRYMAEARATAPGDQIRKAAELLRNAKNPMIYSGRMARSVDAWNARVALAELLNARVVSDLTAGASFPTEHPLYAGAPRTKGAGTFEMMRSADVILSLDWVDLVGALKAAGVTNANIIHVSLDHTVHNGWSMDHQSRPPVDLYLAGSPDLVVPDLIQALGGDGKPKNLPQKKTEAVAPSGDRLNNEQIGRALRVALGDRPATLAYTPISWGETWWPFRHPLDYTGRSGGGGIGAGPGVSVGVALALKDSGRIVVGVCGDGDFLMGNNAVWTAAHYRIPVLFVVANNRSYFNDEVHQERVAKARNRPVENRWIGQRLSDPDVDIAALARAQGAAGFGPISKIDDLVPTLAQAVAHVEKGGVAVVDVRTDVGYMASMMT
jgi:thiamine pyrophosphate-dependent acetolactate synthase large subunit-like protein